MTETPPTPYRGTTTAVIRIHGHQATATDIDAGIRRYLRETWLEHPYVHEIRVSTRPDITWRDEAALIAATLAAVIGLALIPAGIVAATHGYLPDGITIAGTGLVLAVAGAGWVVRKLRRAIRREQADVLR